MSIRVMYRDDPSQVLEEAAAFLASEPVLHNLILTLLHARASRPEPGRYWVASEGEKVRGVVLQSPLSYAASVTPMPPEAVVAVVDAITASGIGLPGVNGDAATAARFAGQWTERTRSAAIPFQGQRLYEFLESGERPPASGGLRRDTPGDRDLVVEWVRLFQIEIGEPDHDAATIVDQWLASGCVWIWDDDGPVSMAVTREAVERVVRIGGVFTPKALRKRGYAGACVSDISCGLRGRGQRAILYTDLGNPTSNSIYRRIGYRAVAEALRYRFE